MRPQNLHLCIFIMYYKWISFFTSLLLVSVLLLKTENMVSQRVSELKLQSWRHMCKGGRSWCCNWLPFHHTQPLPPQTGAALLPFLISAAEGRHRRMKEGEETVYQRRSEPGTWPIRSSTKPHKLLPLLPRPILSSSILKLIRLPASLLFQIVPSIKSSTTLLPLPSSLYRLRQCGRTLPHHPPTMSFF